MKIIYDIKVNNVEYAYINDSLFNETRLLDIAAKKKNATNEKIIVALKYLGNIELLTLDMLSKLVVLLMASIEDRIINITTIENSLLIDTRKINSTQLIDEFRIVVANTLAI